MSDPVLPKLSREFPYVEWLRQESRPRSDADEQELDWCAKMNACADEIERRPDALPWRMRSPPETWRSRAAAKNLERIDTFDRLLHFATTALGGVIFLSGIIILAAVAFFH